MPYKKSVDLKRYLWQALVNQPGSGVYDESGYATRKVAEVAGLRYDNQDDQQRITATLRRLEHDGSIIRDLRGRRTYTVTAFVDTPPGPGQRRTAWFTYDPDLDEDIEWEDEEPTVESQAAVDEVEAESTGPSEIDIDEDLDYERLAASLLGRCIQVVNHESRARSQVEDLTDRLTRTDQQLQDARKHNDELERRIGELAAQLESKDQELADARENVRIAEHNAEVWRKQLEEIEEQSRAGSSTVRELIGDDALAKLKGFVQEQQQHRNS